MILLILLAAAFFLMMLVVMGKVLRNVQTDHLNPAEILNRDSVVARYRPMFWLLDESDCRLAALVFPGNSQLRQIRSERRSLFRIYLRELRADHARIVGAIREVLVESERDLPDLAKALYRCQVMFLLAMMLIEFKLQLHALGVGTVDARSLVAALDGLQLQLQDLVFVQAVIPISGVKLYTECESRIDLTGFSLRLFRMTLTSLLVRLKSERVDRLEMCKSPLTTRVRRSLTVSCFSATLRECCNCAAF